MPAVTRDSTKTDIHKPGANVDIAIAEESASTRWIMPDRILCDTVRDNFAFCDIVMTSFVIRGGCGWGAGI